MEEYGYILSFLPIFIFIVVIIFNIQFRRNIKIDPRPSVEEKKEDLTPTYLFCPACNTKFKAKSTRRCRVCKVDYICPTCRRCRNADQHHGI